MKSKKVILKKLKLGSWVKPFIEELLRGGYIHNPCCFLQGKAAKTYCGKGNKEGGWFNSYYSSFRKAIFNLAAEGVPIIEITDIRHGRNTIYVLDTYFENFLRRRLIEEKDQYRLYQVEDRFLFFTNESHEFTVYSTKMKNIQNIMAERVCKAIDEINQSYGNNSQEN